MAIQLGTDAKSGWGIVTFGNSLKYFGEPA
jgi:hypothetical protein